LGYVLIMLIDWNIIWCIRMLRPYRGLRGEATQYAKVLAKTGQRPSPQGFYRF